MFKKSLLVPVSFLMTLCSFESFANNKDGDLVARMLERIGGKAAWANLKNTINGSMQYRTSEPYEVYSLISMDFSQPRFRIETTATDVHLIRVINGNQSWRVSWSGKVEDLPKENIERDIKWYQAHLYRTIHRIAKGDPDLTFRTTGKNRLEVYSGDARVIWFRLTDDAEPYAFGTWDNDRGSLSGPWSVEKNGIKHPAWVSNHDGTWRAMIRSLEVNVPLHPSIFARPMEQKAAE